MKWIFRVLRRRIVERELDAELRFHIEEQVADWVASGMSDEEARRRVRIQFGGGDQVKEDCRDARGTRWLEDLMQDVRVALRAMRKNPGFTIVAIASLALGIGANTAVYSIVDAVLLRSLPVSHPEQLSFLRGENDTSEDRRFSYPAYEKLRMAVAPDATLAAMSSTITFSVIRPGALAEMVRGQLVTGEWFRVLGVNPVVGRFLGPSDRDGVVLSNGFWKRRFGANPDVIGSALIVNGTSLRVIGVAGQAFAGMIVGDEPDIWAPAVMQFELRYSGNASVDDADTSKPWIAQDGVRWLNVLLRVPEEHKRPAVMARVNALVHQQMAERAARVTNPRDREELLKIRLQAESAARGMSPLRKPLATPLWVLMGVVGTILLIACANLANLLLARSRAIRKEMAVRLAIGAGRGRLVRQLLTETMLLTFIGAAAGVLLANWASQALVTMALNTKVGTNLTVQIDYRVLTFAAMLSVITGLLFGTIPAIRATHVDPGPELKSQARVGAADDVGTTRYWMGKALVGMQIAFSLVLLVAAVLFVRTLQNLAKVNPGYDRESVLTARIELRAVGYREQDLPSVYGRILDRVRSMPGVRSACLSLYSLASGSARVSGIYVAGRQPGSGFDDDAQENFVTPGYFSTVGLGLLRGRDFGPQDRGNAPMVAIVNETFARHFFPDAEPIGRQFSYGHEDKNRSVIVGVVRDARVNDLKQKIPAMAYYPLAQHPSEYIRSVDVRAAGDPRVAATAVRSAIAEVDRNIPVREVVTLAEQVDKTLAAEKLVARLTGLFGVLAIVLACIGLFGVLSYNVARRRGELAIRMALGSSQSRVVWVVLREASIVIGSGVIVGLGMSFAVLRVVGGLLYGLSPTDPATFVASTALLVIVGIAAGWIPAWRASRVDPMNALRYE